MMVIGYLALALALNIVMRVYLQRDIWVKGARKPSRCTTLARRRMCAVSGELASALGEGFADGLDVAGS